MVEKHECCKCPKSRAKKHEEISFFTEYGNNTYKKEDALKGNQYCEEHFEEADKKFNELMENDIMRRS